MARFLHVADIHLGFDRYSSKARSQDFFRAFYDLLKRYAVDKAVDFVVIAGDLFEHRMIQPAALNQAKVCLELLQQAKIPVIAIEGNHDNTPYGTNTSWLKYLSDWGLLILLEPGAAGTPSFLSRWDASTRKGGYIDLDCGVRVVGSAWYGAVAGKAIQQFAEALATLPSGPPYTIFLFHHGLDGFVSRYAGSLRYEELLPLKTAGVDYLALGHIHRSYSVEDWIYNPGSVEANSIEESAYERGAYLVDTDGHSHTVELCTDYQQRAIIRLSVSLSGSETVETVETLASEAVQQAITSGQIEPEKHPMVELRLTGTIGFERLALDTKALQRTLIERSGALIFLIKYLAKPLNYQSPLSDTSSRAEIEHEIYQDVAAGQVQYRAHLQQVSKALGDLKAEYLQGGSESGLYAIVEQAVEQVVEQVVEQTSS